MIDLAQVQMALASISAATDLAKIFKDSGLSLKEAEHKLKVADLLSALADARISVSELAVTISNLNQQLLDEKARAVLRGQMIYEDGYYRRQVDTTREGQYCQRCWDVDQRAVRLQLAVNQYSWGCTQCGKSIHTVGQREKMKSDEAQSSALIARRNRSHDY